MTCADILARVKSEVETSIARINERRVHDERVRGQLESLRHIATLLEVLGEPVEVVLPAPHPKARAAETQTPAPPRKATRAVKSRKRMTR